MSGIKVKGNAAGTGNITIEAPNTNTDRTITLPDDTGTLSTFVGAGLDDVSGVARATSGLLFNGDTAAANALDDYETGTWTPTYFGSTGSPTVTYDIQNGRYIKVGGLVWVTCVVRTDSVSGGSGNLYVSGLPFNPLPNIEIGAGGGVAYSSAFGLNPTTLTATPNTNRALLRYRASHNSNMSNSNVTNLGTGTNANYLYITLCYGVTA